MPLATLPAQPRYSPVHPSRGGVGLPLARLVQRPDHQAAPPPGPAGSLVQPGDREPPHHAHRRERVPRRAVEQPLRPIGRPVTGMLSDCPAIALRRPACHALKYLPACRHGSARAKHGRSKPSNSPRFRAPSRAPILAAAAASGFVVFTHHMIARRLPHAETRTIPAYPRSRPEWPLPY